MNSLEILDTGPLSLIQDLGRIGHLRSGVGVSGAADRRSLRLGNRLVGNNEGAAGVEVLLGGLSLRAQQPTTIAFTGAPAQAYRDGIPVGHSSVIDLRAGQTVRLDYAPSGLRTYLTVRGGIVVPEILGSRSTDTMSGIGPAPLEPGVFLPIGPSPTAFSLVDLAPVPPMTNETLDIRVVFGPRADRFTNPETLVQGRWAVSTNSDRIGARLDRVGPDELDVLTRAGLAESVDICVRDHSHHRIAAGDGVIGEEHDRLAAGWDLDRSERHAFGGQFGVVGSSKQFVGA